MARERAIGSGERAPGAAFLAIAVAAAGLLAGCGGGGGGGGTSGLGSGAAGSGGATPLVARFAFSPARPIVGDTIQFTDQSSGSPTSWAWDFNADGVADDTSQNPRARAASAGSYPVTLTVSNARGSDRTTVTVTIAPAGGGSPGGGSSGGSSGGSTSGGSTTGGPAPIVDIDVDTDRDGLVTNTSADEDGESSFAQVGGAVFYLNADDDDRNGTHDSDDTVTAGTDPADLARVIVRRYPSLGATASVTIDVGPAAAQGRVRIFRNAGGFWTQVFAGGAPSFTLPAAAVASGDVELGIEARARVSLAWDGEVTLTLRIEDGGRSLGSDTVRLRCAPLLLADMTWPTEEVVVVSIPAPNFDNTVALQQAVQAACAATGARFRTADGATYGYDRWIQDSHETGAVYLPAAGQPRRRVDAILQCARYREVDDWAPDVHWGPDFDFLPAFGSSSGSLNYGGNLEVAPPYSIAGGPSYPWGRIVVGGGTGTLLGTSVRVTDHMDAAYREFFDALRAQGPHLEISSEWLAVGHVDEFLMFVPAPARPRGWAVTLASPALARQLLQNVAASGGGTKTVFAGRTGNAAFGIPRYQTTVNAILSNASLMSYNNAAQVRIDSIRALLVRELGLDTNEIVDLPVLYEDAGGAYAVAYSPGVVNLVPIHGASGAIHLLVPDPEGPDHATDVWQDDIRAKLQALGTAQRPVAVTFVDVFNSYHIFMGEAHCGVNFVSAPPALDWWDK